MQNTRHRNRKSWLTWMRKRPKTAKTQKYVSCLCQQRCWSIAILGCHIGSRNFGYIIRLLGFIVSVASCFKQKSGNGKFSLGIWVLWDVWLNSTNWLRSWKQVPVLFSHFSHAAPGSLWICHFVVVISAVMCTCVLIEFFKLRPYKAMRGRLWDCDWHEISFMRFCSCNCLHNYSNKLIRYLTHCAKICEMHSKDGVA